MLTGVNSGMITLRKFGKKHGFSRQRAHVLATSGRIEGAVLTQVVGGPAGGVWLVPPKAKILPVDKRK